MQRILTFSLILSCLSSIYGSTGADIPEFQVFLAKKKHESQNPKHDSYPSTHSNPSFVNEDGKIALADNNDSIIDNSTIQADLNLDYYHSILNSSFFYGNWMSDESSSLFEFKNQQGFVFSNFRAHETFDLQISIFDGPYIDQGVIALSFDFIANAPTIDAKNGTVYFQRLWVEYRQSGPSRISATQNYCLTNATLYFIDLANSAPLVANNTSPNLNAVGIQFQINSQSCPFTLITTVMSSRDELVESQYIPYSIITIVLIIVQGIITHFFHEVLAAKPSRARKVSAWSFMFLNAFDFYLTIFNTANFIDPLTIYAIISIPYLFLSLNMQRVIWIIFDVQTQNLDARARDRTICEMYIWIYILLVLPSIIAFLLYPDFIFYFAFSFLIPQIILNFKQSQKYKTKPLMLAGIVLPKILFMAYLKLDSNNLFRYTPDTNTFLIFMGLIMIQVVILMIQTEWPRFGFELETTYFFFEAEKEVLLQNMCSICLEQFKTVQDSTNADEPLMQRSSEEGKMMRTPCKHEFHEACLRKWLESKLECPYCRHALPPLPDSSEEEF